MPASTDYWINDRSGDPLLVITGELDAALTKALPRLLREVRDVVGERRVTIVFDRGGWSPKLFSTMITDGFDLLIYRKGRCRCINERRFIRRRAELDGRWVDYLLHDQPVRFLKGKLRLRQVTRLCDGGHQTQASRWDLRDIGRFANPRSFRLALGASTSLPLRSPSALLQPGEKALGMALKSRGRSAPRPHYLRGGHDRVPIAPR